MQCSVPEPRFGVGGGGGADSESFLAGRALDLASGKKNLPMQETKETWVQSLGQEDPPRERNGTPLQYSCLGNVMHRGAWWATVCGVVESDMTEHTYRGLWTSEWPDLIYQRSRGFPFLSSFLQTE